MPFFLTLFIAAGSYPAFCLVLKYVDTKNVSLWTKD